MKVKDLIETLQKINNKDARVDLMIPFKLYDDCSDDYCTSEFFVDTLHVDDPSYGGEEYIEIYGEKDLQQHIKEIRGND